MIKSLLATPIISKVVSKILDIVDGTVEDEDLKQKLKHQLQMEEYNQAYEEFKAKAKIITAEAKSEYRITSAWRPIIMLLFGLIIFNNYVLYPYLRLFWSSAPVLELPPQMWGLLKLGISGYIVGRSGEKLMKIWKKKE